MKFGIFNLANELLQCVDLDKNRVSAYGDRSMVVYPRGSDYHAGIPKPYRYSEIALDGIPIIPNIDAAILEEVNKENNNLNMMCWHTCATTHCRAGWAVHLAGKPGRELEKEVGSEVAGALIYAASRPGKEIPNFFCDNEIALDSMKLDAMTAKHAKAAA